MTCGLTWRRRQGIRSWTDAQARAKADYYDVFSQMFRDGFFWWRVGAANHLATGPPESRGEGWTWCDRRGSSCDMQYAGAGIDSIWHQIWKDTISDFPRLAASASLKGTCGRRGEFCCLSSGA
jgi:hypothetical protein